jgi:DNA-binding protein H-NS
MKTYSAIRAEIARLEKRAEARRKSEVAGVIGRIKKAIAAYGLTAADLGFGRGAAKALNAKKGTLGK